MIKDKKIEITVEINKNMIIKALKEHDYEPTEENIEGCRVLIENELNNTYTNTNTKDNLEILLEKNIDDYLPDIVGEKEE